MADGKALVTQQLPSHSQCSEEMNTDKLRAALAQGTTAKQHRASFKLPVQGLECSKYFSNSQEQNYFIFLPRQENAPR